MDRIYAQVLISNQPSWLNFSNNTESTGAIEVSTTLSPYIHLGPILGSICRIHFYLRKYNILGVLNNFNPLLPFLFLKKTQVLNELLILIFLQETVGTRVLVPFPGGVIELFASKQV